MGLFLVTLLKFLLNFSLLLVHSVEVKDPVADNPMWSLDPYKRIFGPGSYRIGRRCGCFFVGRKNQLIEGLVVKCLVHRQMFSQKPATTIIGLFKYLGLGKYDEILIAIKSCKIVCNFSKFYIINRQFVLENHT